MFIVSPFVVVWLVYNVIKNAPYDGPERTEEIPDDDEWMEGILRYETSGNIGKEKGQLKSTGLFRSLAGPEPASKHRCHKFFLHAYFFIVCRHTTGKEQTDHMFSWMIFGAFTALHPAFCV